jgi:hypothetical protein
MVKQTTNNIDRNMFRFSEFEKEEEKKGENEIIMNTQITDSKPYK